MRTFKNSQIEGVKVSKLKKHVDSRGWLCELYRNDELPEMGQPAMCYVSLTRPGIQRGPHEHAEQSDWFCFLGPSDFLLVLWDNRPSSATFNCRMRMVVGENDPIAVIVPPGVVHGYRNVGGKEGLVMNFPDQLFMGRGRAQPVDEIRHEGDSASPFQMDE